MPHKSIVPVIITRRESEIVSNRCKELGIHFIFQNARDKLACLNNLIVTYNKEYSASYSLQSIAYMGDDINDLECMKVIKEAGGLLGCPADAVPQIIKLSDFISSKNGGNGAVREFIEWLIKLQ